MDDYFQDWPQYECRTINNFAPNVCDFCGNLSNRFYWCFEDTDTITWHTMCHSCEATRDKAFQDIYI